MVTVAAGDGAGNVSNCHSIITVSTVDANAPVAVCQPTTVAISLTGVGMLDPATIDGGSADNCGIATLSADVTHFSCPDIGTTNVVLTVEDAAGNSDNCNAIVTICLLYTSPSPRD